MAQQTQPAANTAPLVEFNSLLSRGKSMVDAYKTASMPTSKFVQSAKDFQNAWNQSRDLVVDELNGMVQDNTKQKFFEPQQGSLTYEVVVKGLTADGKYGPKTATALALTLWARMGTWEKPNGISSALLMAIPADPRVWPQQYVANRAMFDSLFLPIVLNNPTSPTTPPTPGEADQKLPPSTPTPSNNNMPLVGGDPLSHPQFETFDNGDGSTVQALTKGKSSTATLVAVGLGATMLGGIVWFATKKKGRH